MRHKHTLQFKLNKTTHHDLKMQHTQHTSFPPSKLMHASRKKKFNTSIKQFLNKHTYI